MKKKDAISQAPQHGNNPFADRFNKLPSKQTTDRFPRVAYVLQGGGALGAYQFGVVKGLLEAGYEPDWVSATSIGAIQAAIIVGNPPESRLAKLEEFWRRVATYTWFDFLGESAFTANMYQEMCGNSAILFGQPGFFTPRWSTVPFIGDPTTLSYYDTSALKETLTELVDFDLLNSCLIRLSLGAVQISSGQLIYFNNINYRIEVEHVMASAALPPGFPAIKIDEELYWDGGVHSNSPLEVILEANPVEDTLCFLIDCFGGESFFPANMNEVEERRKDISYSTHGQRTVLNYLHRQKMRHAAQLLNQILTEKQKKKYAHLIQDCAPHHCTLAHIVYSTRILKGPSKDYNFGEVVLNKRFHVGQNDVQAMLAEEDLWGYIPEDRMSRLYEAPNNHSWIMRRKIKDV